MNIFNTTSSGEQSLSSYDIGLRKYLVMVFNYLTLSLAITGISAYFFHISGIFAMIASTPLIFLIMFAPPIFCLIFNAKIINMSLQSTQVSLFCFAIIMGLSLSSIFMIYTSISIIKTFFMTASVFGTMSIYGHITKRDLSQFGSFLVMGVIGIAMVSVVNFFLRSPAIHFAISLIALFVFIGMTAYDMQKIKNSYSQISSNISDTQTISKIAAYSSLSLYFDFINIFISLLHLFGNRRD